MMKSVYIVSYTTKRGKTNNLVVTSLERVEAIIFRLKSFKGINNFKISEGILEIN